MGSLFWDDRYFGIQKHLKQHNEDIAITSVVRTQLTLMDSFFLQYECGNSWSVAIWVQLTCFPSLSPISVFETSLPYDSAIIHLLRILKWKMYPTQHIRKMYKLGILVWENVSLCIWLLYCLQSSEMSKKLKSGEGCSLSSSRWITATCPRTCWSTVWSTWQCTPIEAHNWLNFVSDVQDSVSGGASVLA